MRRRGAWGDARRGKGATHGGGGTCRVSVRHACTHERLRSLRRGGTRACARSRGALWPTRAPCGHLMHRRMRWCVRRARRPASQPRGAALPPATGRRGAAAPVHATAAPRPRRGALLRRGRREAAQARPRRTLRSPAREPTPPRAEQAAPRAPPRGLPPKAKGCAGRAAAEGRRRTPTRRARRPHPLPAQPHHTHCSHPAPHLARRAGAAPARSSGGGVLPLLLLRPKTGQVRLFDSSSSSSSSSSLRRCRRRRRAAQRRGPAGAWGGRGRSARGASRRARRWRRRPRGVPRCVRGAACGRRERGAPERGCGRRCACCGRSQHIQTPWWAPSHIIPPLLR